MTIHNKIRECRFFADEMTQQALAQAVGVTRQTIMAMEKGKYSPSLEVAFKVAAVFDKPMNDVFWYTP
jgi:putative transcriptional regulator